MKKYLFLILCLFGFAETQAQVNPSLSTEKKVANTHLQKLSSEKVLQRFLSYVETESQSIDTPDPDAFPLTEGQKEIARKIYKEIKSFGGKNVKVTLSDDYYIYCEIPSNLKSGKVPSVLFMAHLDVTPEAPGKGIRPQVHRNYNGDDINLSPGIVLSPSTPAGARLNLLKGKTIITSDGTTLLGSDCKSGVCILVSMIEELINNVSFLHGDIKVLLSQNEDIGRASYRYDSTIFENAPDIVVDVDGDDPSGFSVGNFTAIGLNYLFKGNKVHPSHGLVNKYADALTASAYFIGCLPPETHPSASEGSKGYIHCFSLEHPSDSLGNSVDTHYMAKIRLRYFDQSEGTLLKQYLENALEKTRTAFPFVSTAKLSESVQYENIAYSMPTYVPELIIKASLKEGIILTPKRERGGTTSAMLVGKLPGGPCIYSGQQAEHSCLEWCCLEDMLMQIQVVENIIHEITKM